MTQTFVTNGPKGRVLTRNVDTTPEELGELLKAQILPAVTQVVREELAKGGNGAQGEDMAANLAQYAMPSDDDFDTLPEGDSKPGSNGRRMPGPSDGYELPD